MAATSKDSGEIEKAKKLQYVPWCDEYEKMISGMLYDSFVPELEAARFKARKWCHKFNHDDPNQYPDWQILCNTREKMLGEILGSVGAESFIEPPFICDYGCNLKVGTRFYANFGFCVLDCGLVEIGDRTMLGPGVGIHAATHETEVKSRRQNIEYTRPVTIGPDCWIGANVVILPGVKIGKGCTIGASSVVTKDIPDWSVAMGTPARVVKKVTPVEDLPEGDPDATDAPRHAFFE